MAVVGGRTVAVLSGGDTGNQLFITMSTFLDLLRTSFPEDIVPYYDVQWTNGTAVTVVGGREPCSCCFSESCHHLLSFGGSFSPL